MNNISYDALNENFISIFFLLSIIIDKDSNASYKNALKNKLNTNKKNFPKILLQTNYNENEKGITPTWPLLFGLSISINAFKQFIWWKSLFKKFKLVFSF